MLCSGSEKETLKKSNIPRQLEVAKNRLDPKTKAHKWATKAAQELLTK